jgi:hypothetical protein
MKQKVLLIGGPANGQEAEASWNGIIRVSASAYTETFDAGSLPRNVPTTHEGEAWYRMHRARSTTAEFIGIYKDGQLQKERLAMVDANEGNEAITDLHEIMQGTALLIEAVRGYKEEHGAGRTLNMAARALEDTAMYLIRQNAELQGSDLLDGLRGT